MSLGSTLFYILIIPFGLLSVLLAYYLNRLKSNKITETIYSKLRQTFMYAYILRLFLESSLEIYLVVLVGISSMNLKYSMEGVSSSIATILLAIIMIPLPVTIFLFVKRR